jgi:transmembrane protein TMEM260 (protein O-mannosyltransferase)
MVSSPTLATMASRRARWPMWLLSLGPALAVAALVIVNAWTGLMPGVGFWDTGEFQTVLPLLGTAHPTGYPTYVLVGFIANILLTPIGEPAFRITVLSLLAIATAGGVTVLLVRHLTGSTPIGVAAGLGLALTQVVWANATRADPHPLHLAFVAILLLALVRWEDARRGLEPGVDPGATDRRLVLAAIVFGLAAGNHSLTLLLAPPIALYVLAVEPGIWRRWRLVLACLGAAFGTTALVYLELPVRGGLVPALTAPIVYGRPATWDGFWYIALAEQFRGSLGNPFADLGTKVDELAGLAMAQLGLLALAIPPAVIVTARRAPRYLLLTGAAFIITILFNEAYANADIGRYYLGPVLWVWTWLAVLAAEAAALTGALIAAAATRFRRARASAGTVDRAATLAAIAMGALLLLPTLGDLDERRRLADRSTDTAAQQWLDEALPAIPQGAVLVTWWSTSTPLWYAQRVEGRRADIFIVDDRTMLDLDLGRAPDVIDRYLAEGRPVYAIRLDGPDTEELQRRFAMTKVASDGNMAVWAVQGVLAAVQ